MKIIYIQDNGVLAVITPAQWAIDEHGIEAIALKDVPAGKPFKIVQDSDIPTDRSMRNAWTCSDADLTDGIGAESSEFPQE